jgi:hypothetical protein
MNARLALAAVGALVLLGLCLPLAHAADGAAPPRRVIEERPFGGPPPQRRSMGKAWSTSCKTPSLDCKLEKSQEVGSVCACPGSDGKEVAGVIEEAK